MEDNLPVIKLELNSGVFKIKTPEAIYQISVTADSTVTRVVEKIVEKEVLKEVPVPAPASPMSFENDLFYQELSEEMYSEIGRLARQLSLSIKEIPGKSFQGMDIKQTGIELENAKGQLEDIVQMTEKATMDIMDLAETIQVDLTQVQGQLGSLKNLEFMARGAESLDWEDVATETMSPESPDTDPAAFMATLLDQSTQLRSAVAELPVWTPTMAPTAEPAPAPAAASGAKTKVYSFNLDVVFQTLYELCTNETVKDHIKAMRSDQNKAFDVPSVLKALADLAPTVPVEDTFFNFSLPAVLRLLFSATNSEKYKQILKKMNQTSTTIFLDASLPLEGEVKEMEAPAAASAAPPAKAAPIVARPGLSSEKINELLALIDETTNLIEAEKNRLAAVPETSPVLDDLGPDFTRVKNQDRELIINTLEGSNDAVLRIANHITRILEALSFQDLSGQRILKIVRLISDVQVQLLSLLVSFGSKIKLKEKEKAATSTKEVSKMAQAEVDKMLERVGGPSTLEGPDAAGRLDQGTVDSLLAELGF